MEIRNSDITDDVCRQLHSITAQLLKYLRLIHICSCYLQTKIIEFLICTCRLYKIYQKKKYGTNAKMKSFK